MKNINVDDISINAEGVNIKHYTLLQIMKSRGHLDTAGNLFLRVQSYNVYRQALDNSTICWFSTASESNEHKKNLASGQKGLSVAFDLATHKGTIQIMRGIW